ncbi:hypothetical protein B484DRAFT_410670 [Ochromonadaceae sp. CCMP2298]|nr:hypothetical protein B484DRAFT_410670 [Ochromonadaceae sp. CCMP2298]
MRDGVAMDNVATKTTGKALKDMAATRQRVSKISGESFSSTYKAIGEDNMAKAEGKGTRKKTTTADAAAPGLSSSAPATTTGDATTAEPSQTPRPVGGPTTHQCDPLEAPPSPARASLVTPERPCQGKGGSRRERESLVHSPAGSLASSDCSLVPPGSRQLASRYLQSDLRPRRDLAPRGATWADLRADKVGQD